MKPVRVTVEHPALCLTCEERIEFAEQAWWVKDVGIWHEECPEPSNLKQYQKDADAKQQLR